ncbi:hypothetical protein EON66_06045 [archaeon]|nr:MAG: hypothetical protein EON66_06045 [archaeon]
MESASAGYHGSASARMDVEGDDTGRDSSAPSSPLSATGSTSGASTGRSHSVLGYSTSHENLHAHFTDGAPVGAHVDSPSVAPAHREFTAKRRAHYGGEFAAVRALQARARVGDAQLDDEEAEDKE